MFRKHGLSGASYNVRRSKYGGIEVLGVKCLNSSEAESVRHNRLLAESLFENEAAREAQKMVTAPNRRVMVRLMQAKELSQHRLLEMVGMSAKVPRY